MPLAGISLLCSLPFPMLAAAYWHWKVYGLYKQLGDQVKNISYYWFSTQFQTPGLATQFYRCEKFDGFLPEEALAKIEAARREARPAILAMVAWMVIAVALIFILGRTTNS